MTAARSDYTLAALVIESVTGRPYGAEIRARVIEPLRLHGTSVPGTRVTLPQPSSRGYSKLAESTTGPTYDVTTLNPSLAFGSGVRRPRLGPQRRHPGLGVRGGDDRRRPPRPRLQLQR